MEALLHRVTVLESVTVAGREPYGTLLPSQPFTATVTLCFAPAVEEQRPTAADKLAAMLGAASPVDAWLDLFATVRASTVVAAPPPELEPPFAHRRVVSACDAGAGSLSATLLGEEPSQLAPSLLPLEVEAAVLDTVPGATIAGRAVLRRLSLRLSLTMPAACARGTSLIVLLEPSAPAQDATTVPGRSARPLWRPRLGTLVAVLPASSPMEVSVDPRPLPPLPGSTHATVALQVACANSGSAPLCIDAVRVEDSVARISATAKPSPSTPCDPTALTLRDKAAVTQSSLVYAGTDLPLLLRAGEVAHFGFLVKQLVLGTRGSYAATAVVSWSVDEDDEAAPQAILTSAATAMWPAAAAAMPPATMPV